MTSSGYEKLQKELKKLINEDRPNIIAAIAELEVMGIFQKMLNTNMQKNNKV